MVRLLLMITREYEMDNEDSPAITQKELVTRYIDAVKTELNSEEEAKERRDICRAAVDRLVDKDKLLRVVPSNEKRTKDERLLIADPDRSVQLLGEDM